MGMPLASSGGEVVLVVGPLGAVDVVLPAVVVLLPAVVVDVAPAAVAPLVVLEAGVVVVLFAELTCREGPPEAVVELAGTVVAVVDAVLLPVVVLLPATVVLLALGSGVCSELAAAACTGRRYT